MVKRGRQAGTPSPNYHTNGRTFHSTDLTCIAALHGGSFLWYWARPRDKASHGPIPIPLGYRGLLDVGVGPTNTQVTAT
ncbi:hypothetical protein TNCV_1649351 [Trichonephila clavipes]|nr:hypothetical protein TNCV_1649351 [Trichonephila clavipes]